MNSEDRVLAALKVLAEHDRGLEAPPGVEAQVREGFRRKRPALRWRRAWPWAIAAAVVIAAFLAGRQSQPVARGAPAQVTVVPAPVVIEAPAAVREIVIVPPSPARRAAQTPPSQRREIVTEFFPLVDYAPPFERGELVRVILPASALRGVGIPVREERLMEQVQADILVGQEGLARAIRFVSFEQ